MWPDRAWPCVSRSRSRKQLLKALASRWTIFCISPELQRTWKEYKRIWIWLPYMKKTSSCNYISEVNEVTLNIFISNCANTVVSFLLVVEFTKCPVEEQSMEQAWNSLFNLPPFKSLKK